MRPHLQACITASHTLNVSIYSKQKLQYTNSLSLTPLLSVLEASSLRCPNHTSRTLPDVLMILRLVAMDVNCGRIADDSDLDEHLLHSIGPRLSHTLGT